jgi:hypothetical protein
MTSIALGLQVIARKAVQCVIRQVDFRIEANLRFVTLVLA